MPTTDYSELRAKCLARFEGRDFQPGGPPVFAWHVHHDMLLEPLVEPIANRVDWIILNKPAREIPIRLEWLRPVTVTLPADYANAHADYNKARADCNKAWADYDKARADCAKARADCTKACADCTKACADCAPELLALYREECPGGPWGGTEMVFAETEG